MPYLLKIREVDIIQTQFTMPTTSLQEEIAFGHNESNIFKYDTMILYPYEHFNNLNFYHYSLNVDEHNTYHVEFTPTVSIAPGYEAILEISIDQRYQLLDLGLV